MRRFDRMFGMLVAILATVGLPVVAYAGIQNSAHDFSGTWNSVNGEICVACHTPHDADTTVADAPLWNHELTTASFNPYQDTATLDATDVNATIGGISKLCLSCHDGTVALDNFGGATGGTEFIASTDAAYVGTDLSNDHPVSFTYDDALATTDGELFPPTTTNVPSLGGNIDAEMLFGTGNDQVECASCHDPHGGVTGTKLLVIDNDASGLCLTCHDK